MANEALVFDRQRVLAVVPARGGSKGLPKKNLQLVGGIPLVVHAARIAVSLPFVDRAVISTDDEEIARVAQEAGLIFDGFRPSELSGDRVADWPVLNHELLTAEHIDKGSYDIVLMLQPTCPLRQVNHVTRTVETLVHERLDSVWTVSPSDPKFHPLKQLVVDRAGRLDYFDKAGSGIIARQQLSPLYHRNGAAYAITRQCLVEQRSIKGVRSGAVVIEERMISIDTLWDLRLCEFYLAELRSQATAR
jgi:CMP-N,N'-diacetyllegionaminic acid synthase